MSLRHCVDMRCTQFAVSATQRCIQTLGWALFHKWLLDRCVSSRGWDASRRRRSNKWCCWCARLPRRCLKTPYAISLPMFSIVKNIDTLPSSGTTRKRHKPHFAHDLIRFMAYVLILAAPLSGQCVHSILQETRCISEGGFSLRCPGTVAFLSYQMFLRRCVAVHEWSCW